MMKCIGVDVLRHIHRLACFVHPMRPRNTSQVSKVSVSSIKAILQHSCTDLAGNMPSKE